MVIQKTSNSPFHSIVVSLPDKKSAKSSLHGPLTDLDHQNIISTSDPYNVHLGSGGGTLAAIALAGTSKSVLVIHAGGNSSRCPTQMCLGKAWTTLPLRGGDVLGHPMGLLVSTLEILLKDLPIGSVVVAASDVLLSLPMEENNIDFENQSGTGQVIGIAVPAPLPTAKNHGVFVVNDNIEQVSSMKNSIKSVERFLQKPKITEMKSIPDCTFTLPVGVDSTETTDMAWIDTGVVIFLPPAAEKLRSLCQGTLSVCTEAGLKNLYDATIHNKEESIEVFAKRKALKVELYSHFMLALSNYGNRAATADAQRRRKEEYIFHEKNADLDRDILDLIYATLSGLELKVMVIPKGSFIHLGTTKELRDFLVQDIHNNGNSRSNEVEGCRDIDFEVRRFREFGKRIELSKRSKAFLNGVDIHPSSVVLNSILSVLPPCQGASNNDDVLPSQSIVGAGTVIEHCHITIDPTYKLDIGSNCVVSGLRGRCKNMSLPCNTIFQMIPLESINEGEERYVYIFLSVNDNIKKYETCYGLNFDEILKCTELTSSDLWDEDIPQTLWNARIHPVIAACGIIEWTPFLWITNLIETAGCASQANEMIFNDRKSFEEWKGMERVSLSGIRELSNASIDFTYRHLVSTELLSSTLAFWLNHLKKILDERRDESFNFDFVLDDLRNQEKPENSQFLSQTLKALDLTIISNIEKGNYDISSRSFMLMGDLLSAVAYINIDSECAADDKKRDEAVESTNINIDMLRSTSDSKILACRNFFEWRDKKIYSVANENAITNVAEVAEKAAFCLIEMCVSALGPTSYHGIPPETWAVATAPARIDLSGGWSDTPPISYEFGGAVSCLAVKLDGKKPFSSRCRKLSNHQHVILRTESRNILNGELIASDFVKIGSTWDLADFRDPNASCALLKCALFCSGLVPMNVLESDNQNIQPFIHLFCKHNGPGNMGLELISTSLLPQGSGTGASSILAGCVLSAINHCVNNQDPLTGMKEESESLVQSILYLEQLLSTGGGWQDQIGGLFGGLKLGVCKRHKIPLQVEIKKIPLSPETQSSLDKRLLLAFTGKPRLAKNILQNVLRQWARRSPDITQTVRSLVLGAHDSLEAIERGDFIALGKQLSLYWSQKKRMAGNHSGVEPMIVRQVIEHLEKHNITAGGTLVGAGGGGFLALLLQEGQTVEDVKTSLNTIEDLKKGTEGFKWHQCSICDEGLSVVKTQQSAADFNLEWHLK